MPAAILICVGLPSIDVVYAIAIEPASYQWSTGIVGHQWHWSYHYVDFIIDYDSYRNADTYPGGHNNVEADAHLVLPATCNQLLLINSADVIHGFAVPSMGLKVDANPGFINGLSIIRPMVGCFYGQCSEICGVNHRLMPIHVEVTRPSLFKAWTSIK